MFSAIVKKSASERDISKLHETSHMHLFQGQKRFYTRTQVRVLPFFFFFFAFAQA